MTAPQLPGTQPCGSVSALQMYGTGSTSFEVTAWACEVMIDLAAEMVSRVSHLLKNGTLLLAIETQQLHDLGVEKALHCKRPGELSSAVATPMLQMPSFTTLL